MASPMGDRVSSSRSLVVTRPCRGEPQITLLEQSRERVEIRARLRHAHCGLDSMDFYPPQTIPLRAPLAGRVIAGPGRTKPPAEMVHRSFLVAENPMPDLVGLNIGDALAALQAHGLHARHVGTGTTVIRQTPPAGSPLPTRPVDIQT